MKHQLAKLADKTREWPAIGKAVRIVGVLLQLPELRDRQRLFEEQQLPNLLRTISDINQRQLIKDHGDVGNLLKSVPVSLRRIARDISGLQKKFEAATGLSQQRDSEYRLELETLSNQLNRHVSETQGQLKSMAATLDKRLDEAQQQLENRASTLDSRIDEMHGQLEGMADTLKWRFDESQSQLKGMADTLEWQRGETQTQMKGMADTLEWQRDETQSQLKGMTDTLEWRRDETQRQLEGFAGSTNYTANRIEFVRRELMYEMRYGSGEALAEHDPLTIRAQILSPEKVEAARNGLLRLNLGCGHIPLEGYVNVDRRPLPGVDVVSEADDLPFEQGEVDEIYSAHMLEHFPQEQIRRELFHYWMGMLKCGGKFRAVVPDAETMIRRYADGSYPYGDLREVTFGSQDYDGDFHYNMFTPDSLSELLAEAGFEAVEIMAEARKNGACFEFEVQAIKPKGAE